MLHRPPTEPRGALDTIDESTVESLFDDVAGQINAQHGRLIDLTAWLIANPRAWKGEGLWTPAQYLAWRCGVAPHTARNVVEAVERIDDLPQSIEATRRGELSLDQLMPIVRHVPSWADAPFLSLAVRLTVSQIRRTATRMDWSTEFGGPPVEIPAEPDASDAEASEPEAADPDSNPNEGESDDSAAVADEDEVHAGGESGQTDPAGQPGSGQASEPANRISYGIGPDGRWHMHADLDADLGALIESAINEARDAEFHARNRSNDEEANDTQVFQPVSDVDGLIEMARRSLDALTGSERRNRYRVNLYLGLDGSLTDTSGVTIPESIAELLTCDGSIDPVFVDGAIPISVGQSQRTIPDRTRRTVLHRDGHHCQVPGCTTTRGLELHHIIHWSDHGPTDTWNLITLCPRHHRLHHKRRLRISGDADHPDTLVFTDARGRPIRRSGASPAPPDGPPPPIRGQWEHPYGERLDTWGVVFQHPDARREPRHRPSG